MPSLIRIFAIDMECQARNVSFTFKRFDISDDRCGMKVGTDGVVLGAWVSCSGVRTAIDVGSGSGLIALMLAQRCGASVTALEIDHGAALDARDNIANSPWRDLIKVVEGDFADHVPQAPVDLIISNPPFFANGEQAPQRQRAAARHEGTLGFSSLIGYASTHLADEGRLAMIAPAERIDDIIYLAEMARLKLRRLCRLHHLTDRPAVRGLCEFSRHDGSMEQEDLSIRNESGGYDASFMNLTRDFYLHF